VHAGHVLTHDAEDKHDFPSEALESASMMSRPVTRGTGGTLVPYGASCRMRESRFGADRDTEAAERASA
jgi:hypothetical protein